METKIFLRKLWYGDARLFYTLRLGMYLPFTDHVCVYKLHEWNCRTWTSLAKVFSGLVVIRYSAFIKMSLSVSVSSKCYQLKCMSNDAQYLF